MAGLVAMAMTSCEEDNSLGTMQKNEAPVIVAADGVGIQSLYASAGNKIDLQSYQESAIIPLVDLELDAAFPESSTVTGLVEIADNADFNNAQTISLSAVEAASPNTAVAQALGVDTRSFKGMVNVTAWNDAFVSFYGLNPAPRTNYLRYKLWLNNDKQNVILYDNKGNEWFDAMEFTVTPLDAKLDVAKSYTLYYTLGGGATQTMVMYHNPDMHVYDDPNFNATVEVTEDENGNVNALEWWIAPTDNTERVFGVAGDDPSAESGDLEEGGVHGQLDTPGVYKIEANMLELTYLVKLAPASLYVMSTSGTQFTNCAQLGTTDNITYEGMAGLLGPWGLAGQAAYKPTLYVNDPSIEVDKSTATYKGGMLLDTSGAPLNANSAIPYPGSGAGLYYITANLQTMTYTGYQCKTLGLTGTINDWGATDDIALKGSRTTLYMEWTGDVTLKAGDEWKIRANNDWAVNFGGANGGSYTTDGTPVELSNGGDNFVAEEAGTFTVTVKLRRYLQDGKLVPYTMTVVKK